MIHAGMKVGRIAEKIPLGSVNLILYFEGS